MVKILTFIASPYKIVLLLNLDIQLTIPKKNAMKYYASYHTYSTSKEFIEHDIKKYFKWYVDSLKCKIKEAKNAEKNLNQLLKHNLI